MTIDERTANALLTQFNQSQIYHDNAPEQGDYPLVTYTDISETPALHADNKLYAKSYVIRVTIATNGNAGINELKEKVYTCMTEAGFMWEDTNKIRDNNIYYTAMDFSYGELV